MSFSVVKMFLKVVSETEAINSYICISPIHIYIQKHTHTHTHMDVEK